MDIKIKLLINNGAKKIIRSISKNIDDNEKTFIIRWLGECNDVKCYILYENNIIKSFAILSKCDFDSFNKYNNPYILDYIFTYPEFRRNNFAYELLNHIKISNEISAFCNSNESKKLFIKSGYKLTKINSYPNSFFRYP